MKGIEHMDHHEKLKELELVAKKDERRECDNLSMATD